MNAYELAEIMTVHDESRIWEHGLEIANMLRQQADRIAELESCLDFALQDTMDYITLNNLDGENNHWLVWARKLLVNKTPQTKPKPDGLIDPKSYYIGYADGKKAPQTKPLSDEEICKIYVENTGLGVNQKEALQADLIVFARAIEERHGIK